MRKFAICPVDSGANYIVPEGTEIFIYVGYYKDFRLVQVEKLLDYSPKIFESTRLVKTRCDQTGMVYGTAFTITEV